MIKLEKEQINSVALQKSVINKSMPNASPQKDIKLNKTLNAKIPKQSETYSFSNKEKLNVQKYESCLKQKTYKFKKLTNFINSINSNNTDYRKIKIREKDVILPNQNMCGLKKYPSRAEEKEKFYQLLHFLKKRHDSSRNSSFHDNSQNTEDCLYYRSSSNVKKASNYTLNYSFEAQSNDSKIMLPQNRNIHSKFENQKQGSKVILSKLNTKASDYAVSNSSLSIPKSQHYTSYNLNSNEGIQRAQSISPKIWINSHESRNSKSVLRSGLSNSISSDRNLKLLISDRKASNGSINKEEMFDNAIKIITNNPMKGLSKIESDLSNFIQNPSIGENDGEKAEGKGVLLTNKNELIEGHFSKGIILSGNSRILYSNGEYYNGIVKEGGQRHGEGIHYYSNGDIYDGEFVNDNRIGKSRLRFRDGSEYIGQFIDDMADGHGLYTDKEGNRFMTLSEETDKSKAIKDPELEIIQESVANENSKNGHFLKGKLYGKGEIKFKNGNTYIGQLKGTKRNGYGTMQFVNPQIQDDKKDLGEFVGFWKRDKRDGQGEMKYLDGSIFNGIWKNDMRYKGELIMTSGNIYKGMFLNNVFDVD